MGECAMINAGANATAVRSDLKITQMTTPILVFRHVLIVKEGDGYATSPRKKELGSAKQTPNIPRSGTQIALRDALAAVSPTRSPTAPSARGRAKLVRGSFGNPARTASESGRCATRLSLFP